MAILSTNEKQLLERLFQMGGGYVLNFSGNYVLAFQSDESFVEVFKSNKFNSKGKQQ
jgi:hypothetical protein